MSDPQNVIEDDQIIQHTSSFGQIFRRSRSTGIRRKNAVILARSGSSMPKTYPGIPAASTLPDLGDEDKDEYQEIKRTSSGGILFFKKKSPREQEEVSRARAQQLSVLYETNSTGDRNLIKPARLVPVLARGSISMRPMMSPKEAQQAFRTKHGAKLVGPHDDPLLTDHEKQQYERQRHVEAKQQSGTTLNNTLSRPPLKHLQPESEMPLLRCPSDSTKPRAWKDQEMARAILMQDKSSYYSLQPRQRAIEKQFLPESIGMEVIHLSSGKVAVAMSSSSAAFT